MRNNIIFETNYWVVKLTDNQNTIGRCVIDVKSDCGEMSKLTKEEWEDFRENVVINLENVMKKNFDATMFNWSCLMNNAFKGEGHKPHVHFHFRPRYRNPVNFNKETFPDKDFGAHYDRTDTHEVTDEMFKAILEEIKGSLE